MDEFPQAKGLPPPPRDPGRWYKGWPVPYTILWPEYPAGAPDWTTADTARIAQCLDRRLCGVCGQKLEQRVAFIGGAQGKQPEEIAAMAAFFDPAMHNECAEYAAKVCPFLGGDRIREDMGDHGVQYVWYGLGVFRISKVHSRFRRFLRAMLIPKKR